MMQDLLEDPEETDDFELSSHRFNPERSTSFDFQ